MKVEEGIRLALESRHLEKEEEHPRIEDEEEARLVEEERLKSEEEEEDLRLTLKRRLDLLREQG